MIILPQNLEKVFAADKHEKARKKFDKIFVNFPVRLRLSIFRVTAILICVVSLCTATSIAQTGKPKAKIPVKKKPSVSKKALSSAQPAVVQIDGEKLRSLLKPKNGTPLLVNFWATWCDPCREEFPDLVKIDADYKGKIDFITVSLDDLAEIKRDVPKFLAEMRAEMPAYLLKTADEEAAIASVSRDWKGGLPLTILFNATGEIVYNIQGKVKVRILRAAIDKVLTTEGEKTALPNPK